MGKYSKREFQCGEWFLVRRSGSEVWQRGRYVGATRRIERFSLGTTSLADAKQRLEAWWLKNREAKDEKPADASLADIFRRYWENHACKTPSASGNRDALKKWLDFWGDASVADLSVPRQEKFVKHLEGLGNKRSTISRVVSIGKAAVSWARKRGELTSMPYIVSVTSNGGAPPMGRPLSLDELIRLY